MATTRRLLASIGLAGALAVAGPAVAEAAERLVLIGGGTKPPAAVLRFVEWAGGPASRILIVPWASAEPAESASAFQEDLAPHHKGKVDIAPLAPLDEAKRSQVKEALQAATGVFFTGGDQGRIMDELKDDDLLAAFVARFREGIVFAGSSAGTAIMSPRMITGNGDFTVIDAARVETRPGLGLLQGTIVDQHFVKRQRENRLFGLILAFPDALGVGIDEDTALVVEDGKRGSVMGDGVVVLVDGRAEPGALVVRLARPGQSVDLESRRVR